MKNYIRKIINYIKKNKIIFTIVLLILLILGIVYFIFFRTKVNTIKSVKKVLSPNYYDVECIDSNCEYISAYKGNKYGDYTIFVYNAKGKKIAKIKDKYDSKSSYVKTVSGVTKKYVILSKNDYVNGKTSGYTLVNTKGKQKYNSDNVLYSITDYLVAELSDKSYKIIDLNGKTVFKKIVNLETYANKEVISVTLNNENIIADSKGKTKLSGYNIVHEVTNDKGKTLFFVVQDTNKNGYYYYNYKTNKVVGDSFNGYIKGNKEGELIITKKSNGNSKKYVLTKDGKQEEYVIDDMDDLANKIKNNIDTSKYFIYSNSIKNEKQKSVLVNNDNSFGVYNLSSKKYTKLLKYTKEKGGVTIIELDSNKNGIYLLINCNNNCCDKNISIVYDVLNNKELYKKESKDNIPQNYIGYEGDYKVIKYSLNSSEEYKEKYVLYDKNSKELYKSDNEIVIVDKKKLFGEIVSNKSLILYSVKDNKILNDEDNLASRISINSSYVYKYSSKNKVYIIGEKGKELAFVPKESASFIYSDDAIIYIENNKLFIINPANNRTKSYRLKKNEKINDNNGENIYPYKNSVFINNSIDENAKIININGRTIKKIRYSSIDSVYYNSISERVIIITKRVNNNKSLYGLYIAK